jgi:four helix bundle protein
MSNTIQSFTDLKTWQEGHQLVIQVYKMTSRLPRQELYSLGDQIRRSSISITSNIAEGFGRHSYKEKIQFYYLSLGSLTELKNQLLVSRDVGYIEKQYFNLLAEQTIIVSKLLTGLIRKSKMILQKSKI